jgi:hypothetical protein
MIFGEKPRGGDSKTGKQICSNDVQKMRFAHFLSAIGADV